MVSLPAPLPGRPCKQPGTGQPHLPRTGLSEDAYLSRMDVLHRKSKKGRRVECHICRKELARGSLASHLASQHEIYHAHLMADEEEEAEEVCIPVPAKPTLAYLAPLVT